MGDKLLLLTLYFLLFTAVKGQSATTTPTDENEDSDKSKKSSEDLQSSESNVRFLVLDPSDEKNEKPDNGITSSDDDSDDESEELKMLESLLVNEFGDTLNGNYTELDDSTGIKLVPVEKEEPLIAANSDDVETRSPAPEYSPPFVSRIAESEEGKETGRSSFESENARYRNEPRTENSPVLQLTQGGYQRPFQAVDSFRDQRQSLRSESAPQQAEAVQTRNNENFGHARARQQSTYSSLFQPPFAFQPGATLRHPFSQSPANFANAIGRVPNDIQNSFYNTQPDFSQSQYPQLDSTGDFPNVQFSLQTDQRNPFSNPEYLFQAPFQIPVSQSMPVHMPEQVPQLFQSSASPSYSNYENPMNPIGPGFSNLFRSPQANTQYLGNSNTYSGNPSLRGNIFSNPTFSLLPNYPNTEERSQLPPQFIGPQLRSRIPIRNSGRSEKIPNSTPSESEEKQTELLTETPNKEDPVSVPYGARIQRPNNGEEQDNFERQDNVYMRYPITEAGYATEESLPPKNITKKEPNENEVPLRQPFPFFTVPRSYGVYNSPDPYRAALETVQRGFPNVKIEDNENKNGTENSNPEQFTQGLPMMSSQPRPEAEAQLFSGYPERDIRLAIPETPFYPIQNVSPNRNPFEPVAFYPENHFQFPPRPIVTKEQTETPTCAKTTNDSVCFEDVEYPRGEILYALNSDAYLIQRMVTPDQQLDKINLIDRNSTEDSKDEENYICKSEIKYGLPLRAQNTEGNWKVIVNMEKAIGRGDIKQPVRLEICREMGNPCTSVTEIKTSCVQKYSIQHLLSWTVEKGVHNDVYRLPIACSCQILEPKA